MAFQHASLASGRWFALTIAEQMGNIGSEVSRAVIWEKQGDMQRRENATDRMLELFDLTLADSRWAGARRKEIARAREAICDSILGGAIEGPLSSWQSYFDYFALAARSSR